MSSRPITTLLSGLALAGLASAAAAQTDLEEALANGGERLTADEIAERFKGKTVTFAADESDRHVLIYYGAGNEAAARALGGDTVRTGFHAVNDRDRMRLGWEGRDLPRLRCLDVVEIGGVVHKFRADGSLGGHIAEFADGNTA